MATTTAITLCNTALLMVGADEITSFTDENNEAKICNQIYNTTRDTMLQKFPWRFSLDTVQLSKLTTPPSDIDEFGYLNAFLLPSDSMRIIATDDPTDNFKVVGENMWSNRTDIRVIYQKIVTEDKFPAYFKNALETELAAKLSLALIDDASKNRIFRAEADVELARAKNIDSQGEPVPDVGQHNYLFTFVRT
jgi:hypothetical protein